MKIEIDLEEGWYSDETIAEQIRNEINQAISQHIRKVTRAALKLKEVKIARLVKQAVAISESELEQWVKDHGGKG